MKPRPPSGRAARVLAIETSSRTASIALGGTPGDLADTVLPRERAHARDLIPALESLWNEILPGVARTELEALIVGTGPGSYTGLRVGIATALALARASGAQLRGVPSFEAIAFQSLEPGEVGCVLTDARAGRIYAARYGRMTDDVEELSAPCAVPRDALRSQFDLDGRLIVDAGLESSIAWSDGERARLAVGPAPSARVLHTIGRRRLARSGPQELSEVRPLYLQPFGK